MSTDRAHPSPDERSVRAWVEVQAGAVRRNLRRILEALGPGGRVIPMVKADAYGLGMERTVQALEPVEPWGYGVATLDEGRRLRDAGVERPVVVFSPLTPGSYQRAVEAGLTVCVSDLAGLRLLEEAATRLGRRASMHVEVDTGMGRTGFDWRDAGHWGEVVRARHGEHVRWAGCFTHLHSADDPDPTTVRTQWERLKDTLATVPPPDDPDFLVHVANSAGALRCGELLPPVARPGIFLYGGRAGVGLPDPEPVASVRARVLFLREAPPGTTLGYGATYSATGWERWATLGIGYGDGLPRALGNRGHAIVRGRRVPIVGRISMDVTVINISDVDGVELGDAATLIGRDGREEITVDEVADLAATISYEILTGLTPRLRRIWVDDGGI